MHLCQFDLGNRAPNVAHEVLQVRGKAGDAADGGSTILTLTLENVSPS